MSANSTARDRPTRVVHCKHAPYDVYIGRPSRWGNPLRIVLPRRTRERAIREYYEWLSGDPDLVAHRGLPPTLAEIKEELQGRVLGCWCKPKPCHGDILAALADGTLRLKQQGR